MKGGDQIAPHPPQKQLPSKSPAFLGLKCKENCKISVIKFYKAILHLKSSNFRKRCAMPLKF